MYRIYYEPHESDDRRWKALAVPLAEGAHKPVVIGHLLHNDRGWWGHPSPAVTDDPRANEGQPGPHERRWPALEHLHKVFGYRPGTFERITASRRDKLLRAARAALGAFDALEAVGDDVHLPGFERCRRNLVEAIAAEEGDDATPPPTGDAS